VEREIAAQLCETGAAHRKPPRRVHVRHGRWRPHMQPIACPMAWRPHSCSHELGFNVQRLVFQVRGHPKLPLSVTYRQILIAYRIQSLPPSSGIIASFSRSSSPAKPLRLSLPVRRSRPVKMRSRCVECRTSLCPRDSAVQQRLERPVNWCADHGNRRLHGSV
jgi:hypothetical protein